jgi:para-aminobenzoate synthetase component 1
LSTTSARATLVPIGTPSDRDRERHLERVRRARESLLCGVIYQANVAHRLRVDATDFDDGAAFFAARALSAGGACPPCAAFVDVPGWGSLISLSPERFVIVDEDSSGKTARAFPIKGTRPRGVDAESDAKNLAELCASEKDAAEHVMIVDLLRNDLGKVAVAGGVTVEKLLAVMRVKNVHHLESTVAARLRHDVTLGDVLAATIPGGSITGAPKSSAVDVIHALEDGPRGLYTGVLALIDGPRMVSSLLIRTWMRPDAGPGSLHVGGGIVVDSDPMAEWLETLDKSRAFTG